MGILEEKVRTLPESPGVYLMKGEGDTVLYVGKAKDLRARIRAYTGSGATGSIKNRFLLPKVRDLDYIVTQTEKEALLLENTLIKKYRPHYNVVFKDDKTYLHLVIDLKSPYPRIALARRPETEPGLLVFGPYASASAARETLRQIQRVYPLRTCKDRECFSRTRPCINYQMRRCLGPCVRGVSEQAYREMVDQAIMVLQGRSEELVEILERKMEEASEAMRYEEAAVLRDRIRAVRVTVEQQRVVSASRTHQDVFGIHLEGSRAELCLLQIRNGSLVDRKGFTFTHLIMEPPEFLASFLLQYYSRQTPAGIPEEIVLPFEPEGKKLLEETLSDLRKGKVSLCVPKRAKKHELLLMANLNAETRYRETIAQNRACVSAMDEVRSRLGMDRLPRRIDCIDISAIQGRMAVGARVTFKEGLPYKEGYRRYRIEAAVGADDYAMMYEVLRRSYGGAAGPEDMPDLLLVDGGKGHMAIALRALKDMGIRPFQVAAMAKGRHRGAQGRGGVEYAVDRDRVFVPGRFDPVRFNVRSPGFRLLQQVRNEAHRFANAYHRRLRSTSIEETELEAIPGVGKRRRVVLFAHFGDIEQIRKAGIEELSQVPHIPADVAERIWRHFHSPEGRGKAGTS